MLGKAYSQWTFIVKKQATENKKQTASTTLFRTKEAKNQKTSIVEKLKLLDLRKCA